MAKHIHAQQASQGAPQANKLLITNAGGAADVYLVLIRTGLFPYLCDSQTGSGIWGRYVQGKFTMHWKGVI